MIRASVSADHDLVAPLRRAAVMPPPAALLVPAPAERILRTCPP